MSTRVVRLQSGPIMSSAIEHDGRVFLTGLIAIAAR